MDSAFAYHVLSGVQLVGLPNSNSWVYVSRKFIFSLDHKFFSGSRKINFKFPGLPHLNFTNQLEDFPAF